MNSVYRCLLPLSSSKFLEKRKPFTSNRWFVPISSLSCELALSNCILRSQHLSKLSKRMETLIVSTTNFAKLQLKNVFNTKKLPRFIPLIDNLIVNLPITFHLRHLSSPKHINSANNVLSDNIIQNSLSWGSSVQSLYKLG